MFGNMTGLAERLDKVLGRVAIVLNDQKTHGKSLFAAFSNNHTKRSSADDNPPAAAVIARGGGRQARHPDPLHSGGGRRMPVGGVGIVGTDLAIRPQGTPASGGDGCRRMSLSPGARAISGSGHELRYSLRMRLWQRR